MKVTASLCILRKASARYSVAEFSEPKGWPRLCRPVVTWMGVLSLDVEYMQIASLTGSMIMLL